MRYGVGILNFEMTIILLVTTVVLFVALVSPHLLPTVVLPISDAILIVCFVVSSTLFMRFIGVKETKKLERKIVDKGDVYAKSNEDKICNFGFAIPREYEKRPVSA